MAISITEKKLIPYMLLFDFCSKKYGTKFPAIVSYAYGEASNYKCNGTLLVLWACVRSRGFTSKEYHENTDIFSLGGKYATYRSALATGASELSKFNSTDMLQEQEQIEKLWTEAWDYANNIEKDIVQPPAPPVTKLPSQPVPKPVPEDVPAPVEKPSAKWNVKAIAKTLAAIAGAAALVTPFIPGIYDDIVVKLIKFIADFLSNVSF